MHHHWNPLVRPTCIVVQGLWNVGELSEWRWSGVKGWIALPTSYRMLVQRKYLRELKLSNMDTPTDVLVVWKRKDCTVRTTSGAGALQLQHQRSEAITCNISTRPPTVQGQTTSAAVVKFEITCHSGYFSVFVPEVALKPTNQRKSPRD
jgi:hypothetical protein